MPLATIKVIEGVFSGEEKQRMVLASIPPCTTAAPEFLSS